MVKRFAFKDNTGKIHYRTKHTLETMKKNPGFSYKLLHWWNMDYWRIRILHWKISDQRLPALINTNKKPVANKKLLAKKVAFKDNMGKVHYRSNYTLGLMKQEPGFTYTLVSRWKRDYWKARSLAKKENQPIDNRAKEQVWEKRIVYIDKRGNMLYSSLAKFEKMKQKPGFTYELVSRWHFDYWRVFLFYWIGRVFKTTWSKVTATVVIIIIALYLVLNVLYSSGWMNDAAKHKRRTMHPPPNAQSH